MSTQSSASLYDEEAPPKVIQERIKKRKPNPNSFLSSKEFAAKRFGDQTQKLRTKPALWHKADAKANKNGKRRLIVLDDGTEYTGDWKSNLRHGKGKHYTAEGVYEGGFVDDLYEGEGQYYLWSDKSNCGEDGKWLLYDGEWLAGKMDGNGSYYLTNGDVYQGEFREGKRCGQGTLYYENKDVFFGEWFNDMKNGEGELTKANQDVFRGVYKNDKRNGPGELHIKATQRRLEGVWVDDMMKFGSYYDEAESPNYVSNTDISGTTDGMIPTLGLKDPDAILAEQEKKIAETIDLSPFNPNHQNMPLEEEAMEEEEYNEV